MTEATGMEPDTRQRQQTQEELDPSVWFFPRSFDSSTSGPSLGLAPSRVSPPPQSHGYSGGLGSNPPHFQQPQQVPAPRAVFGAIAQRRAWSPPGWTHDPYEDMNMMPSVVSQHPESAAPAAGPSGMPMAVPAVGGPGAAEPVSDGRKAKRELSQSKRAAQNRAAQRAFRQRKEGYIKKLEQQVRDYSEMESAYKASQNENDALREYIFRLHSKMEEAKIDIPHPPPSLLLHPSHLPTVAAAGGAMGPSNSALPASTTPLARVAQAAAQYGAEAPFSSKAFKTEPINGEVVMAEAIDRQLQPDSLPVPAPQLPPAPM